MRHKLHTFPHLISNEEHSIFFRILDRGRLLDVRNLDVKCERKNLDGNVKKRVILLIWFKSVICQFWFLKFHKNSAVIFIFIYFKFCQDTVLYIQLYQLSLIGWDRYIHPTSSLSPRTKSAKPFTGCPRNSAPRTYLRRSRDIGPYNASASQLLIPAHVTCHSLFLQFAITFSGFPSPSRFAMTKPPFVLASSDLHLWFSDLKSEVSMAMRNRTLIFRRYRDALKSVRVPASSPSPSTSSGGGPVIELVNTSLLNPNRSYTPLSTEDPGNSRSLFISLSIWTLIKYWRSKEIKVLNLFLSPIF